MARLPEVHTSLRDAVRLWLDHRSAYDGRSPATIEQYGAAADRLLRFTGDIALASVTRDTLLAFRAHLMTGHALAGTPKAGKPLRPQTVASYLRAVINLFNWCAEMGLISANPAAAKGIIPKLPRDPKRAPDRSEVARLLAAVEQPEPEYRGQVRYIPAFAARGRALLWIMLDSGMRVGELANLDISDYDPQRGALHIRDGKGGHSRWVFLSPEACHALDLWVVRPREQLLRRAERAQVVAQLTGVSPRQVERLAERVTYSRTNEGPLFVDRLGERMSAHAIRIWLRHLCERAKVPVYRPHDLRRLYITTAAASGMPLPQVMQQVGHAKAETTMGYIVADTELQRQAALSASPLRRYRRGS